MTPAVVTRSLGRRYGRMWALRDCSLAIPAGRVVAVVGPNGAGKTTLLNLLVGFLAPSEGEVRVFDQPPVNRASFLSRVGFVAQNAPLYRDFNGRDLLHLGRRLNPTWDDTRARRRLATAKVPLDRKVSKLSGGQHAQLALALAIGKQPDLLILDEPLASLDPLARREFLQTLMTIAAEGTTVILSSHLVGELARVCDYLMVVAGGRLRLAGELDKLLEQHRWVVGPSGDAAHLPDHAQVILGSDNDRLCRKLVRTQQPLFNPALVTSPVDLEDLVLAYLEADAQAPGDSRPALAVRP
jgi:ABC-2 type transport system ATP-binding protein